MSWSIDKTMYYEFEIKVFRARKHTYKVKNFRANSRNLGKYKHGELMKVVGVRIPISRIEEFRIMIKKWKSQNKEENGV